MFFVNVFIFLAAVCRRVLTMSWKIKRFDGLRVYTVALLPGSNHVAVVGGFENSIVRFLMVNRTALVFYFFFYFLSAASINVQRPTRRRRCKIISTLFPRRYEECCIINYVFFLIFFLFGRRFFVGSSDTLFLLFVLSIVHSD